jgi:hypothetical protein
VGALEDYLKLWRAVQAVPYLGEEEDDSFRWKWTASGRYTTKFAYRMLFKGKTATRRGPSLELLRAAEIHDACLAGPSLAVLDGRSAQVAGTSNSHPLPPMWHAPGDS